MKAFRFPLESLRTLRKQRENAAQQNYARALAACDHAARSLVLAEEELKTGHAMFQGELSNGSAAGHLVQLTTWCAVLEVRKNERAAALAEARRGANDAFQAMTMAVREREALDRFHDKSLTKWQREYIADEQKMFDELAVQRQPGSGLERSLLN